MSPKGKLTIKLPECTSDSSQTAIIIEKCCYPIKIERLIVRCDAYSEPYTAFWQQVEDKDLKEMKAMNHPKNVLEGSSSRSRDKADQWEEGSKCPYPENLEIRGLYNEALSLLSSVHYQALLTHLEETGSMPNFTCPNCNLNIYACTEQGCCNNCSWNWTNREGAEKKVTVITTQPKNGQTGNDGLQSNGQKPL